MSAVMKLVLILLGMIAILLLLFVGGAWVIQQSRQAIESVDPLSDIKNGVDNQDSEKMTEDKITWEEAVELIRNCQVTTVFQTHSKNVSITLTDETTKSTTEPELDLVLNEASKASEKCGFEILAATE